MGSISGQGTKILKAKQDGKKKKKKKKTTTKPKIGRRKDLLLVASKESIGDHSQSIVSLNSKTGHFKLRAHAYFMKGRVQALVDTEVMRIRKDQHHYPFRFQ